ncbi:unnamed protein product [Clavelina lepadiformis]|uniref:Uncharacterized protein n=1 Tax=Clavelina lepadiformis TaxID=159417 RepID=A0ABP0FVI6_CLALP
MGSLFSKRSSPSPQSPLAYRRYDRNSALSSNSPASSSSSSSADFTDPIIPMDNPTTSANPTQLVQGFNMSLNSPVKLSCLEDISIEAIDILENNEGNCSAQTFAFTLQSQWNITLPIRLIPFYILAGDAVRLEEEDSIARKTSNSIESSRLVFSGEPLIPGDTWYLRILEKSPPTFFNAARLRVGVTSSNPMTVVGGETELTPGRSNDMGGAADYWVMYTDFIPPNENEFFSLSLSHGGMMKYRAGANTARDLFPCDVAQPLWIVIDCGQFERIVSLGLSHKQQDASGTEEPSTSAPSIALNRPENSQTSSECVICCSEKPVMVVYDCGHLCLCEECSVNFKNPSQRFRPLCPICRKPVQDIIKMFRV